MSSARIQRTAFPSTQVPPNVASVLVPSQARLTEAIVSAISAEVPEYAGRSSGRSGRRLGRAVAEALRGFVALIERSEEDPHAPSRAFFDGLGCTPENGHSLDALLAAYRVGARVAWQDVVTTGTAAGLEPETLYKLADSIFAYVDALSAATIEGFRSEYSPTSPAQQARQHVVELLTIRAPAEPREVDVLARQAGWSPPARVAALVTADADPGPLAGRVGPDALGARLAGVCCVLVSDPEAPGRTRQLVAALQGKGAAIGPTVSTSELQRSWQWARRAFELVEAGAIRDEGLVRAETHLETILLHENETLAAELARRALSPLDALSRRARHALPETLLSWLSQQGDVRRCADDLHVHPQTVRYRLRKLRELYGRELADPDARFTLELGLRAAGVRVPHS